MLGTFWSNVGCGNYCCHIVWPANFPNHIYLGWGFFPLQFAKVKKKTLLFEHSFPALDYRKKKLQINSLLKVLGIVEPPTCWLTTCQPITAQFCSVCQVAIGLAAEWSYRKLWHTLPHLSLAHSGFALAAATTTGTHCFFRLWLVWTSVYFVGCCRLLAEGGVDYDGFFFSSRPCRRSPNQAEPNICKTWVSIVVDARV